MSSGTIAYNVTKDNGGGIYGKIVSLLCADGENLIITDNKSDLSGNAIYIEANSRYYLTLGGSLDLLLKFISIIFSYTVK